MDIVFTPCVYNPPHRERALSYIHLSMTSLRGFYNLILFVVELFSMHNRHIQQVWGAANTVNSMVVNSTVVSSVILTCALGHGLKVVGH